MAWTSPWSDSRQCQVGNQALNTMQMGTEGIIESETGDRGWMRLEMIIALVHMANVALMLSMLTLLGFATNNTQISPGLTLKNPSAERAVEQKRERERDWEREVRYRTDGTRMPASPPGSWHQAWASSAHSNCLHFQIYDCMINEDFILPSATLQSVFPINKEPDMTQGDWFLISIWCHHAESTFL